MHPRWVLSFLFLFIYLFIAFDCSLEILERKDCWYLEGKWVRDGQKLYLEGKWVSKFFFFFVRMCFCFSFSFFFSFFFFFFFSGFGCSLEMFERNDYLYLEGKWVMIVCIWRENGSGKIGIKKCKILLATTMSSLIFYHIISDDKQYHH